MLQHLHREGVAIAGLTAGATVFGRGAVSAGELSRSEAKLVDALEGDANGAPHAAAAAYASKFTGKYTHRVIVDGIGHNLPQEAPQAFAQAIIDVDG